ncbi:MAG TPA: ABC transporter permease [Vicinamibacterales bacterium]|nr:ABC transporter permease [Vicinamibacterales bacterium]
MGIRRRLRSVLWRVPVEEEVRQELSHHADLRTQELVERGWTPAAARSEAERRVRGAEPILNRLGQERNRTLAMRELADEFRQDVAFALRQFLRRPGFTAAAVLTLALGIGGTTTIFSLVHAVMIRPFPFPDPDRVLFVYTTWRESMSSTSAGNYDYMRQRVTRLEHLAAASYVSFNLTDESTPERVLGMRVTWNYLPVFGIQPLLGRTFSPDEDRPGHDRVVVLSHRLWQRRFGADRSIPGRTVHLNGQPHDVVGVMPPSLDEIAGNEQLWVPAAFTAERLATHDEHYLELFGLRRADATLAQVNEELARLAEGLRRDHAEFNLERGAGARVYGEFHTASFRTRTAILLAAVVAVLLIACGNVANLLLASLASRSRELAVRAAIGAGRRRIVRQVITESLVLAFLGGFAGVAAAYWTLPLLIRNAPALPRLETAALNTPVLAVAVALVAASAVLVGLLPAWLATRRRDLRHELGDGRDGSGGNVRTWLRQALVGAQAALALVVLAGAALLVRSAINMQQVPLGFDLSGALVARVGFIGERYRETDGVKAGFRQLLEYLQTSPGIGQVALDSQPPLVAGGGYNGLIPEGRPISMESVIDSRSHFITPDYFRVLGIALKAGRFFTPDDVRAAPLVMIVNEALARRAFGGDSPIGRRMACCEGGSDSPVWKTIVGVVGDVRSSGPGFEPRPEFYLPLAQVPDVAWSWIQNTLTIVARPRFGEPDAMAPAIRDAVHRVDPGMPVFGIGTFDEGLRLILRERRFNTMLLSLLGLTGLVLAALGIYSVLGWLVAQRRREIGVRMALGATASRVARQVALDGLRPVALGLAAGQAGAFAAMRLIEAQLFRVSARDPVTLGAAALLMVTIACAAAMIPAWRAACTDPASALRD